MSVRNARYGRWDHWTIGSDAGVHNLHIFVLSPHRDDAAFSIPLAIDRWLRMGHIVVLINIFTRSVYAPRLDFDKIQDDRLTYVSSIRRKEDEHFLRHLSGLQMTDLELDDAPLRLHCDSRSVCETGAWPDDTAVLAITEAVRTQMERAAPMALVAPLALGHHVDHCAARDAALSFACELPVAFYEDLPYATRDGAGDDLSRFRAETDSHLGQPLCPVFVQGPYSLASYFRLEIAMIYASQIDLQLAKTIAAFCERYEGAERLWANQPWLDIAPSSKLSELERHEGSSLFS